MKVGSALDPEFSSTGTEREREREYAGVPFGFTG
jgi:hypothetical protein